MHYRVYFNTCLVWKVLNLCVSIIFRCQFFVRLLPLIIYGKGIILSQLPFYLTIITVRGLSVSCKTFSNVGCACLWRSHDYVSDKSDKTYLLETLLNVFSQCSYIIKYCNRKTLFQSKLTLTLAIFQMVLYLNWVFTLKGSQWCVPKKLMRADNTTNRYIPNSDDVFYY